MGKSHSRQKTMERSRELVISRFLDQTGRGTFRINRPIVALRSDESLAATVASELYGWLAVYDTRDRLGNVRWRLTEKALKDFCIKTNDKRFDFAVYIACDRTLRRFTATAGKEVFSRTVTNGDAITCFDMAVSAYKKLVPWASNVGSVYVADRLVAIDGRDTDVYWMLRMYATHGPIVANGMLDILEYRIGVWYPELEVIRAATHA